MAGVKSGGLQRCGDNAAGGEFGRDLREGNASIADRTSHQADALVGELCSVVFQMDVAHA
jgi:hypothetical protein